MFVKKIKNQWLDSIWLQTTQSFRGQTDFCETLFKTTLSSAVRKNSLRFAIDIDDFEENISAFNLMPEKSQWHIVSRIVLWAIVIMTTKVLGLINFVHFIMKVQLHLQFANFSIWNLSLLPDFYASIPTSSLQLAFISVDTIMRSRPSQPLTGEVLPGF